MSFLSLITEAQGIAEFEEITTRHMNYYNKARRHSSIDYRTPAQYLADYWHQEDVATN